MSFFLSLHPFNKSSQDEAVQLTSFKDLQMENVPADISNEYWISRDGDQVVKLACKKAFEGLGKLPDVGLVKKALYFVNSSQAEKYKHHCQVEESETKKSAIIQHLMSYAARKWDLYLESLNPELARTYTTKEKSVVLSTISNWLGVSSGAGKSALESATMGVLTPYNLADVTMIYRFKNLRTAVRDDLTKKQFEAVHCELNNVVDEYSVKKKIMINDKFLTSKSVDYIFDGAMKKIDAQRSADNINTMKARRS
ncbi:hypothetical protein [Vibrio hepatarius]|uniref:hypothetical protein n=1 Tax=Vibrio hepatarius TaxID=171383 RepID=UPI001C0A4982|nr:hypothetical protein [Vibrio hepatarius]MBU2895545.1 hypothetical protein [Vibrio hepatarius]